MSLLATNAPACVTFRTSLECELSRVSEARLEVRRFLEEQAVSEAEICACELALAEACNNAVQNVTIEGKESPVEILVICTPAKVELHVSDHTPGFDWPEQAKLPECERENGRGIFFIQSFMDGTNYFRGTQENNLVMRKMRLPQLRASAPAPSEERALAILRSKLAESQEALTEMARESCFRSETLAAICRCSADLGRSNDLKGFAERLLSDLLHIAAADWFVVRTINPAGTLSLFVASADTSFPADLDLNQKQVRLGSIEAESAATRKDLEFGGERALSPGDPLSAQFRHASGFVHPIRMDQSLIGTLVIGRSSLDSPFSMAQRELIRTFADFLAIQVVNARLRQEHLSTQLLSHELEIARGIQRSLLPRSLPRLRGFQFAAHCESARQVGGDFYDMLQLSETSALLVIADVMGKGVPAALFAALLRSVVRSNPELSSRPAQMLARINELMFDDLSAVNMFITTQIVLLDSRQRKVTAAGAGHCPLLIASERSTVGTIVAEGMPVGVVRTAAFEETQTSLEPGSRLLLYTDGVTESRNAFGEAFGEERLQDWFGQCGGKSAAALKSDLIATLNNFELKSPLQDDRTFLIAADEETSSRSA